MPTSSLTSTKLTVQLQRTISLDKVNKGILLISVINQEAFQDYDPRRNSKTSGESHGHSGFLHRGTFWTTDEESGVQKNRDNTLS